MSNVKFNFKYKKSIYFFIFLLFVLLLVVYLFNIINIINKNKQFSLFEAFNSNSKNHKNNNIILIGDSILNNTVYVFANESVPDLIKNKMQPEQLFYNFAKDGATIQDCITHLANIPEDKMASINALESDISIFVSAGGNDILNSRNNESTINALFEKYIQLISDIKKRFNNEKPNENNNNNNNNINIIVLNLYYPFTPSFKRFYPFIKQWNELLEVNQEKNGYQLLKIDSIIVDPDDLIYDIEPSFKGGKKIAEQII
jgi:hypothetical protein